MAIAQSCGSTSVAIASRDTFCPIASCTDSVAMVTAGSFVLILARSGTSLLVSVVASNVETIARKHSSVCTLTDKMRVRVNRS